MQAEYGILVPDRVLPNLARLRTLYHHTQIKPSYIWLHCEKNNPKVVIPAKDYGMSVEKLDRNWTN